MIRLVANRFLVYLRTGKIGLLSFVIIGALQSENKAARGESSPPTLAGFFS